MSPFEHGEVFVLDDGGEVTNHKILQHILFCASLNRKILLVSLWMIIDRISSSP